MVSKTQKRLRISAVSPNHPRALTEEIHGAKIVSGMEQRLRFGKSAKRRAIEERLRINLNPARAGFELAKNKFEGLKSSPPAPAWPSQAAADSHVVRQAGQEYNSSLREYHEALRFFRDYMIRGDPPALECDTRRLGANQ